PPSIPEFNAKGVEVIRFIGSISPSAAQGEFPKVVQAALLPATFIESQIVSWFQSTLEPKGFLLPRVTAKKPFCTRTPPVEFPLLIYDSVHLRVPSGLFAATPVPSW